MSNRDPQWIPWTAPFVVEEGVPAWFNYGPMVSDPDGNIMSFKAYVADADGNLLSQADELPAGWTHNKAAQRIEWSGVGDKTPFLIVLEADDFTYDEALERIAFLESKLANTEALLVQRDEVITTLQAEHTAHEAENLELKDKLALIHQTSAP